MPNSTGEKFMRIALRDFLGRPKTFYDVQVEETTSDPGSTAPVKSHHIVVVDRSGSMYYDMADMKTMIEKVFTLDEFRDGDMNVTLISYSSSGDYTEHFVRSKVSEIMEPNSPQINQIRSLKVTGLTCASQALRAAINHIRSDEVTAISLHSDGYFNDLSPGAERREIDKIIAEYQKMSNVFVNTIAYRGYCDFGLLSLIANSCSGQCFRTPSTKEFYTALVETSKLVSGNLRPVINVSLSGSDYVTFVCREARKFIGSGDDFQVLGLPSGASSVMYRWKSISESEYNSLPQNNDSKVETKALLSLAAAKVAEGHINEAKYALVSARAIGLLATHGRALTNPQVAAMAEDLEKFLFGDDVLVQSPDYGMPGADETSVLKVLKVLSRYAKDLEVDMDKLSGSYQRRGVRSVPGTRLDDGTIRPPNARSVFRGGGSWGHVNSFDLNRSTATINMQVSRAIDIIPSGADQPVTEVAGKVLNLMAFNNYTIVSDGSLNVPRLHLKIKSEALHRRLVSLGVLGKTSQYDPTKVYLVSLEGRPLIDYDSSFSLEVVSNFFDKIAPMLVVSSILRAYTPPTAGEDLTESQIQELDLLHISPKMYFTPPTTNEYTDLKEALSNGTVDSFVKYNVTFGSSKILNSKALPSANAFLKRRFEVSVGGVVQDSPNFLQSWNGWTVSEKKLTARTKLTPVDDLMFPIFEDFLGTRENGRFGEVLASAGLNSKKVQNAYQAIRGKLDKDDLLETLSDLKGVLEEAIENLYEEISNIVFYIGSTGLLPEGFGEVKAMTADQIFQIYGDLKIGKAESDGTFYDLNGTVLSIFPETAYFSTERRSAQA